MELLWNELNAQRLIYRGISQHEAEGALPIPAGRQVSEILDYNAGIFINSCKTDENKVNLEGHINAFVLCTDERGELFSFTSESDFTHCIDAENAEPGMNVNAEASIKTLSIQKNSADTLSLSLAADIDCMVISGSPLRLLDGIKGIDDLEMKTSPLKSTRRVEIGNALIRLSEELASEGADDVPEYSATISVRDTSIENGNASVSGVVTVNLLAQTSDGEFMQLVRNIPFRENIRLNTEASEIYATAELTNLNIRALGTEFSLIAFDADALFKVYGLKTAEFTVPLDAYSPSLSFNCLIENLRLANTLGGNCVQQSMRENISVPEGMADIFASVFSAARPVVTSISFAGGEMNAEGLLITRLIYKSGDGNIHSFTEEVPFEINMAAPADAASAFLKINASAGVTGGGGKTAQISYNVDASAEFFGETEAGVVAGIAECEDEPRAAGIVVYNAQAGETVFDVAKKFRIPTEKVRALNKNIEDTFAEGDKLMLLA